MAMINHIAVKFVGLTYSAVPPESFKKNHETLIDLLRASFPRFDVPTINNISVNLAEEQINTEKTNAIEVHMVSADSELGVKIGNQGIFLSVDGYMKFSDLVDVFKPIVEAIHTSLGITHFSQVHLRNINLFPEVESNKFRDIRNSDNWGRQDILTLASNNFSCNGAATRHEYISEDYMKRLQISSGVVFSKTHSYIPQEEWDIWRLRGRIPVAEEVNLLIDISGTNHQAPINDPEKQHTVKEYNWDKIAEQLNSLHDQINSVYGDILTE